MAFSQDTLQLFAGSQGGTVLIWDNNTGKISSSLKGHLSSCTSIALFSDPYKLATGSQDTNIKLWDLRTKNCISTLKGHSGGITSLQVAPNNNWLCSTSEDGTIKVWNFNAAKLTNEIKCSDIGVITAKVNPYFYTMVAGSKDKRISCYDLEQFKLISEAVGEPIRKIEFEPTGKYVFTATDNAIKLSNAETLQLLDCKELPGRRVDDLLCHKEEQAMYMISTNTFTFSVLKAEFNIFNHNHSMELDAIPTREKQRYEEPMEDVSPVIKNAQPKTDPMKFKANIITTKTDSEIIGDSASAALNLSKESVNIDSLIQMDSSKSISMISQLLEQHLKIKQALQRRKNNALTLLSWWEKSNGDLSPTIKALMTINDIATMSDFFNFTFAIGLKVESLTLDNLVDVIPLIGKVLNTKYDHFIVTALKTLEQVYKCHSNNIIQAKKFPSNGPVDIAREERMKKYDVIVGHLFNISQSQQFQSMQTKQGEIGILSQQMDANLKYLNKECNMAR